MMAYATAEQMKLAFDATFLGDMVRDDATRASPSDLELDEILQEMLDEASGLVDSAALIGGRYTVADLEGLTGNAAASLRRIVMDLAVDFLWERRVRRGKTPPVGYGRALAMLDRLREGKFIFATQAAIDAGKVTRVVLDANRTLAASARRCFGDTAADRSEPRPKGF